jgi:hypothetical protein
MLQKNGFCKRVKDFQNPSFGPRGPFWFGQKNQISPLRPNFGLPKPITKIVFPSLKKAFFV